jgi:2-polyprenyl-3-methyl-5-hydroxy-6-metoxy-1,4-benzoquinol methylase
MKNYEEVIQDLYAKEQVDSHSIYNEDQPIGQYSRKVLYGKLNRFVKDFEKKSSDLNNKKILDIGCGTGGMLAYFTTKGFAEQNAHGIDLSERRVQIAREKHPNIHFSQEDIVAIDSSKKFDLVTTFDVLSHLQDKDQIVQSLQNIHNLVADDGNYLWYDIYAKDHFDAPIDANSWGFSHEQMISLADEAGFEVQYKTDLFKSFFNRYHSLYQARRIPFGILSVLEKIIPGSPGNVLMVLKKK